MKNSASCQRGLISATLTLIQSSSGDSAVFLSITSWAPKTIGPPVFEQPIVAILFTSESFVEDDPTHVFIVMLATLLGHDDR